MKEVSRLQEHSRYIVQRLAIRYDYYLFEGSGLLGFAIAKPLLVNLDTGKCRF